MSTPQLQNFSWERMIRAVEKVRERLLKAVGALEAAKIPYAVVGGNAVAAWVATVDESSVRNTRDVDLLLDRATFEQAKQALERAGFEYRHVKGIDMFLDGPQSKAGDAVHVLFARELVRQGDPVPTPSVAEAVRMKEQQTIDLQALVRMKLTSFRLKDQVHLQDMLGVGLIDESWLARLPEVLAARLKQIIDNPEG